MPRKPIEFSLDFMIKDIFSRFTIKQFDDVSFNITPLIQGKPYDTTNMTGKIFVGVNDDMFMQTTNITVSSNNINVLLDRNMLQKQGRAYAEIELTDNNGTITSSSFIFDIDPKIGEGGQIPGEYEGFVAKYENLISQFKTQINNAVLDSQSRTTSAIAVFDTNGNTVINTIKANGEKVISTFSTNANNKLTDVENRFQKLTASKQQDSEIIDARDNEISLHARLERDLAKGKIIEETASENYITIKDSVDGSITDIEILGNTVQSVSDLSDIQSVGTLQEDRRYKMSILSCGKNLFDGKLSQGNMLPSGDISTSINTVCITHTPIKVAKNKNYILSLTDKTKIKSMSAKYKNGTEFITTTNTLKFNSGDFSEIYVQINLATGYINGETLYRELENLIQLEEGTVATTYESYQSNKSSILLPCQLEKVGDIKDRLFRREDGVWCIEKNIGEVVLNGSESWGLGVESQFTETHMYFASTSFDKIMKAGSLVSNRFPNGSTWDKLSQEGIEAITSSYILRIRIAKNKLTSQNAEGFKTWLSQNPTLVKYVLATPQIIELPLDTQIQLNSFNGITNIFTEDTVIEPTIKCTIPKSLGASVQSLVNKTDNLSQRVEAVEKLKEGNELEITTESGYVVCENSNNGQIEGLKVEGRTLVNLSEINLKSASYGNIGTHKTYLSKIKPNTTYTVILNIKSNTLSPANSDGYVGVYNEVGTGTIAKHIYIPKGFTGVKILNLITPNDLSDYTNFTYFRSYNVTTSGSIDLEEIILEGDYTQNPPSYFEGLKSVGDGTDKIEALSNNVNYFNPQVLKGYGTYNDATWDTDSMTANVIIPFKAKAGQILSYTVVRKNTNTSATLCYVYEDGTILYDAVNDANDTRVTRKFAKNVTGIKYIKWGTSVAIRDICLVREGVSTAYTPYQSNKKQILIQNADGNYEKPILRSTGSVSDTIEKHSDGKYYFHKKCGEVVLNGSESWTKHSTNGDFTTLYRSVPAGAKTFSKVLSSYFTDEQGFSFVSIGKEAIKFDADLYINISNSKLSTQDAAGFKTWLSQNPITVVYELATEEVYECVNLDLDSYEGETSVIFDGGAISPKITFKIASHIANTINVLKDRINYLEDKIIGMFKAVLCGDVQTLAYTLYPEDFEKEEEIETVEGTELL